MLKSYFSQLLCILFALSLSGLISCNSYYDDSLLEGTWKVSQWVEASSGKRMSYKMDFDFKSDKTYSVDYGGGLTEAGTYFLAGEYLNTTETGATQKSVKIKKLNKDTIIFHMNRAGSLEEVLLVRR